MIIRQNKWVFYFDYVIRRPKHLMIAGKKDRERGVQDCKKSRWLLKPGLEPSNEASEMQQKGNKKL